jgi:FMN reductase
MAEHTSDVVLIAGSPTLNSRSSALLAHVGSELGASTRHWSVRDFEPADLLLGRYDSPQIVEFVRSVSEAKALLFSTPVYKAVYAGALKVIVDLIAPDALQGKVLLGLATAKLDAHETTVDRAFVELFKFFRGSKALPTLFLLDSELTLGDAGLTLSAVGQARVAAAVDGLRSALR